MQPTPMPAECASGAPLLDICNLHVAFPLDEGLVHAVEGVSLRLDAGHVLGLVGESGCGKSVTAQSVLRIVPRPGRITSGQILLRRGSLVVDIAQLSPTGREIRTIRGQDVAMIFQEPMSSFSPLHTIGNQIVEAIRQHQALSARQARVRAIDLLAQVGIPNPGQRVDQYPHELSGGMRQRAMIATALSCNPSLLIADEPTTALDVTIQAQILDLLRQLQESLGMAVLFITHNLGVVAQVADNVTIMYLGHAVENGPVADIFAAPAHPYTRELLKAIPRIGKTQGQPLAAIKGSVPGPFERPGGCRFHPRCKDFIAGRCDKEIPEMVPITEHHQVRCFLYG
jgi:oligopeptide/dipeptide ABC transporter ATP-binding protein